MDKITRILLMYSKLIHGKQISKLEFCLETDCNPRSFDRDIEDIRLFLSEAFSNSELIFEKESGTYRLTQLQQSQMNETEAIVFAKLLLESKAFRKDELKGLLTALYSVLPNNTVHTVQERMQDDCNNYVPAEHQKAILKTLLDLYSCISQERKIVLSYKEQDKDVVESLVSPVAISFSAPNFYLVSYDEQNSERPERFRVDQISQFEITDVRYSAKLKERYK